MVLRQFQPKEALAQSLKQPLLEIIEQYFELLYQHNCNDISIFSPFSLYSQTKKERKVGHSNNGLLDKKVCFLKHLQFLFFAEFEQKSSNTHTIHCKQHICYFENFAQVLVHEILDIQMHCLEYIIAQKKTSFHFLLQLPTKSISLSISWLVVQPLQSEAICASSLKYCERLSDLTPVFVSIPEQVFFLRRIFICETRSIFQQLPSQLLCGFKASTIFGVVNT